MHKLNKCRKLVQPIHFEIHVLKARDCSKLLLTFFFQQQSHGSPTVTRKARQSAHHTPHPPTDTLLWTHQIPPQGPWEPVHATTFMPQHSTHPSWQHALAWKQTLAENHRHPTTDCSTLQTMHTALETIFIQTSKKIFSKQTKRVQHLNN